MEKFTADVLEAEYPELHSRITAGMPRGQYAFGIVQNTKGLRDALNKAR
jgi:hypothetical protein